MPASNKMESSFSSTRNLKTASPQAVREHAAISDRREGAPAPVFYSAPVP
jgi:hypothetical protein